MPLDRAWADEQLGADLRVRVALARESCDLRLLRRQLVPCFDRALADRRTGREELAMGTLSESIEAWSPACCGRCSVVRVRRCGGPRAPAIRRIGDEHGPARGGWVYGRMVDGLAIAPVGGIAFGEHCLKYFHDPPK